MPGKSSGPVAALADAVARPCRRIALIKRSRTTLLRPPGLPRSSDPSRRRPQPDQLHQFGAYSMYARQVFARPRQVPPLHGHVFHTTVPACMPAFDGDRVLRFSARATPRGTISSRSWKIIQATDSLSDSPAEERPSNLGQLPDRTALARIAIREASEGCYICGGR